MGGGKIRDPYAIERDLGRIKRHKSRGCDLTPQPGDGNVNHLVYESLMKNCVGVKDSDIFRMILLWSLGKQEVGSSLYLGKNHDS